MVARSNVEPTNKTPSGRVRAAAAAPMLAARSPPRAKPRPTSKTPSSQSVAANPNSAVSSPELVHVRNVRLVSGTATAAADNTNCWRRQRSGNGPRHTIAKASASDSPEKNSEMKLDDPGGSIPVARQTPSSTTIHRKFEYPSTARNGGGFQV